MGFAPPEQTSGEKSTHPQTCMLMVTAVMLLSGKDGIVWMPGATSGTGDNCERSPCR